MNKRCKYVRACIASAVACFLVVYSLVPTAPAASWVVNDEYGSSTSPAASNDSTEASVVTTIFINNDFERLVNLMKFRFVMNARPCSTNDTFIKIIHSSTNNFEKRMAIRRTWGSYSSHKLLFILGYSLNSTVQRVVLEEQSKFNDLIQGNFIDEYRNLTYKHVMALKWIHYYCSDVKYVLKTDDDVFINMPNFLTDVLPNVPTSNLIYCDVVMKANVKRSSRSKWRVSHKEYMDKYYPNYCPGWVILYTGDIVLKLYQEAQKYKYFWIDDVLLTGVLAKKLNITHKSIDKKSILKDLEYKSILSEAKWPKNDKFLVGPYDVTPNTILELWKLRFMVRN